jgi:hypothetical protein
MRLPTHFLYYPVPERDLVSVLVEVAKKNWSLGNGEAQYAD